MSAQRCASHSSLRLVPRKIVTQREVVKRINAKLIFENKVVITLQGWSYLRPIPLQMPDYKGGRRNQFLRLGATNFPKCNLEKLALELKVLEPGEEVEWW